MREKRIPAVQKWEKKEKNIEKKKKNKNSCLSLTTLTQSCLCAVCVHVQCGLAECLFSFTVVWKCVSEQTNPESTVHRLEGAEPFKKQALGTRTTIGKALYWSSTFKMQHRIKGYMLLHVTHNKVSRIVCL